MLLLTGFIAIASSLLSQVCVIDYTNTATGIYPDTLPEATVNDFYDEDITFVLPTDTMGIDFTNFEIISVSLPMGLSWECSNQANGCNYDPQADPYGCARVFGTPLIPGQYEVEITVIADLTISSGNVTTFSVFLEVLPETQSNAGFAMNPSSGCDEVTVEFTNNNPSGNYSPIPDQTQGYIYNWDFDNGLQSSLENPNPQTYSTPGQYLIDYTCLIDTFGFFLENITVNSVSCSDPIGYGDPDLYLELYDGDGALVFTSSEDDSGVPTSWTLNIHLNNPPYSLMVWDEDSPNIWGTDPDNCVDDNEGSTASVNLSLPAIDAYGNTQQVANNGGLNLTYTINKPTIEITAQDTVNVFQGPAIPDLIVDQNGTLLSTPDLGFDYQWYLDNNPIPGATNNTYEPTVDGLHYVAAFDTNGCFATSEDFESTLGISISDHKPFNMYPNPTNGQVNLELKGSTEISFIQLMDVTGRIIYQNNQIQNGNIELDFTGQSKGVYNLVLGNNHQKWTNKLVIQ